MAIAHEEWRKTVKWKKKNPSGVQKGEGICRENASKSSRHVAAMCVRHQLFPLLSLHLEHLCKLLSCCYCFSEAEAPPNPDRPMVFMDGWAKCLQFGHKCCCNISAWEWLLVFLCFVFNLRTEFAYPHHTIRGRMTFRNVVSHTQNKFASVSPPQICWHSKTRPQNQDLACMLNCLYMNSKTWATKPHQPLPPHPHPHAPCYLSGGCRVFVQAVDVIEL